MSDLENVGSPAPISPVQARTWDFLETAFVVLVADGVFTLTAELALTIILLLHDGVRSLSPAQLQALWMQGNCQGAGIIIASPPTIAVLWVAIRMARREFAEYLALNWPSLGELVRALGLMALVLVVETAVQSLVGTERPATQSYLVVNGAGGLLVLLIGGCIVGPMLEEFVVRGFMFRGWSESFLGPVGAIALTSALWAMNHAQYDWHGRLDIFVMGLALGYFRWRSDSTWLTVMVHSAVNTFLFFTMGPYV